MDSRPVPPTNTRAPDHLEDTQQLYSAAYYREHCGPIPYDRSVPHWGVFFGGIADMLVRSFRPRRVFDAGCAVGFLVEAFWDRGVEAWGRDISAYAISEVRADLRRFCSAGSIADPIPGRFDLVTCIEVVEHMPEAEAEQAIRVMTQAADLILFSSSPTDLEEVTHINVRPVRYWLQLFAAEGFEPLLGYDPTFVTPHCLVLQRATHPVSDAILQGCAEIVRLRLAQADRDETIRTLHRAKAVADQALTAAGVEHGETRLYLREAEQLAAAASAERNALRAELDQARAETASLAARLDAADAQRAGSDGRIRSLEEQLAHAGRQSLARGRQVDELSARTSALSVQRDESEAAFHAILRSPGYNRALAVADVAERLPAPLRRAIHRGGKLAWWTITRQLRQQLRRRRNPAIGPSTGLALSAPAPGSIGMEPAPQDVDAQWYLALNPDVGDSGMAPAEHHRDYGQFEGRGWGAPEAATLRRQGYIYLRRNQDVADSGTDPAEHFLQFGVAEGRTWPSQGEADAFAAEEDGYLSRYPDVEADAWEHFNRFGAAEGRSWTAPRQAAVPAGPQLSPEEQAAANLPWVNVLRLAVQPDLAARPRLNVLVPGLGMRHMSGGPNTAVNLACRLAAQGVAVRLVATSAGPDADPAPFWRHAAALSGTDPVALGVELVDASGGRPFAIGENDMFMATAWWTAQAAKYAVKHTRHTRFIYLIQDHEALLHPASTQQALAEETYGLDHLPIINSTLLRDYLVQQGIGRFADPAAASQALVFEPAIDPHLFRSAPSTPGRRRRLLFYARPENGLRNLFELGVAALRTLIATGVMDPAEWDVRGMGEAFEPVELGRGCTLSALPWHDLDTYAEQMRTSDVLLSLMLSPHPSYPPLEMAACGRPVVTTVFGNKDAAALRAISPNIIGVQPTIEALAAGLALAFRQGPGDPVVNLPRSWDESLDGVLPHLLAGALTAMGAPAHRPSLAGSPQGGVFPGFDRWPADGYGTYRLSMLADRAGEYRHAQPELLSFVTTVWNTAPRFLLELAETVFGQDSGPGFEWVILDNGSVAPGTLEALATIARHPAVRLFRVEQNAGIVGGMRRVLEEARHRYILPLDSDDLLTPDCVRVLTSALAEAGYPLAAYTDEDKQLEGRPRDPYSKPDWDPVLFTHSCYIAHLCAIDRQAALRLGCYTDPAVEGSHDWDSFTRLLLDGQEPLHVPELLYTWRMHPQSTALNVGSKSFIHDSQRAVLGTFLRGRGVEGRYTLAPSPLFGDGAPDWRFQRDEALPRPVTTLLFGDGAGPLEPAFAGHEVEPCEASLPALLDHAAAAAARGRLLHLLQPGTRIADASWVDEALALFELFPGTAMVGGRIHCGGHLVAADMYFGFDGACGTPNAGRALTDPGFFAQAWKPHSASAVPLQHCVVDPGFLLLVLPDLIAKGVGTGFLSAWLGAAARERRLRCIYTPFFSAAVTAPPPPPSRAAIAAFTLAHAALIPDTALLSPRLGLTPGTAYTPVLRAERAAQARAARQPHALPYPEQHAAELAARRTAAPAAGTPAIAVLTTVYIRTDAALFRETAAALLGQTLPPAEWLVLAHGPIRPALEAALAELEGDGRVRLLRRDTNLGIIGGMRLVLEAARSPLVLPLDADDVLTVDALERIGAPFRESCDALAFSDEDILSGGAIGSPIRRTAFDPVLNDEDSTIWHLCAFGREAALRLGVYSDAGAEYCHDWDTVRRFAADGAPVHHVPHVLYHWRHHAVSTSGSGTANTGSLASVRHVLEGLRARQADPALYEVAPYPLDRGAPQLGLLRRPVRPLPLCLMVLADAGPAPVPAGLPVAETRVVRRSHGGLAASLPAVTSAHVVLLDSRVALPDGNGLWDAMRLFELHSDLAAVGGRILDRAGTVAACCDTPGGGRAAWLGQTRFYPGAHALALKAQTATALADGLIVCTTDLLRAAVMSGADQPLADALADVAAQRGLRMAYSPLLEGTRT